MQENDAPGTKKHFIATSAIIPALFCPSSSNRGFRQLCLFLLLLLAACKSTDETDPSLNLSQPAAPLNLTAGDTLRITGTATDDLDLSEVRATLLSDLDGTQEGSDFRPLEGQTDNFDFEMIAGDRFTPSGNYSLRVRVTDAAGNFSSRFIPVTLTEMPRVTFGWYISGNKGQNEYELFRLNASDESIDGIGKIDEGLTDLQVDPIRQYLLFCTETTSRFTALRADDPSLPVWSALASNGALQTAYTGFAAENNTYLAVLGISPYARAYDENGDVLKTINALLHPATAVARRGDRFVVGQSDLQQTTKRLDLYHFDTQAFLKSYLTGWDVEAVRWVSAERIIACGNSGSNGTCIFLDQNLIEQRSLTLSGTFRGISSTETESWILTDQGVFRFDHASQSLSPQVYAGNFTAILEDSENNRIWLGGNNEVIAISPSGALLKQFSHNFGQVKFISAWTNK